MSISNSYKNEANKESAKDIEQKEEWKKFIKKTSGITIHAALMDKHHPIKDYYLRGKQYGMSISVEKFPPVSVQKFPLSLGYLRCF